MKFREKMKKFYYVGILLLMSMLAVGTVLAEEGDNTSYSLMIIKYISASGMSDEELEAVLKGEYVFEINAVAWKDGKEGEPEKPQTVTFGGPEFEWEKIEDGTYRAVAEISYSSAVKITVAELTDHVENAGDWDMTATECESRMYVPGKKTEIDISKEGGLIHIVKLGTVIVDDGEETWEEETWEEETWEETESAETVYFKITGPGSDGSDGSLAWSGSITVEAAVYSDGVLLDGLKPGHYEIEELKADGFKLQANREVKVAARDTGTVHINGESGKLTIVAPEGTDDHTHYYRIVGPNKDDIVPIKHEEEYTLENLNSGDYTVTEYTYSGQSGFTVKTSKTTDLTSKTVTKTWSNFEDGTLKLITAPSGGDALRIVVSDIVGPSQGATFRVMVKAQWEGTAERTQKTYAISNFKSTSSCIPSDRAIPGTQVSVGFKGSSGTESSNVTGATVKYILERYGTYSYTSDGADKTVTVDKQGMMGGTLEITKPADDSSAGADQVVYTFTVSDSKGNKVGELELKAGETGKLTKLAAGKYTVSEKEGKWSAQSKPFTLKVEDTQDATSAGASFTVNMLHAGSIKLHKSGSTADDGGRDYTFLVSGPNGYKEFVKLQAGMDLSLGGADLLPAGTYTVKAVDDAFTGFDLFFSDSSTVDVLRTEDSFSTIYFTNHYTKEEGSYRVVHEYYLKDSDGHYIWEGSSNVSTVRGLSLKDSDTYGAGNVTQLPVYDSKEYRYTEAAYGTVTALADLGIDSAADGIADETGGAVQPEEAGALSADSEGESGILSGGEEGESGALSAGTAGDSGILSDDEEGVPGSLPAGAEGTFGALSGGTEEASGNLSAGTEGTSEAPKALPEEANGTLGTSPAGTEGTPEALKASPEEVSGTSEMSPPGAEGMPAGTESTSQEMPAESSGQTEASPTGSGTPAEASCADGDNPSAAETVLSEQRTLSAVIPAGQEGSEGPEAESASRSGENMADGEAEPSGDAADGEEKQSEDAMNREEKQSEDAMNREVKQPEDAVNGGIVSAGTDHPPADDKESNADTPDDGILKDGSTQPEEAADVLERQALTGTKEARTGTPTQGYETNGIVSSGIGADPDGNGYQYSPDSAKGSVTATKDGEQIIILRYVREEEKPVPTKGSYKVVHEYYRKTVSGEEFEGRSRVTPVEGDLPLNSEMHYTVDGIDRVNIFSPRKGKIFLYANNGYNYGLLEGSTTFDGESGGEISGKENYRPDSSMQYVFATEAGSHVIILRYVRPEAAYNVVHEYYVRKPKEEGASEAAQTADAPIVQGRDGTREEESADDGPEEPGGEEIDADDADDKEQYEYVFEGRSAIEQIIASPNATYTEGDVNKAYRFRTQGGSTYAYQYYDYGYGVRDLTRYNEDDGKPGYGSDGEPKYEETQVEIVTAVEEGDQIIILRYYREEGAVPLPEEETPKSPEERADGSTLRILTTDGAETGDTDDLTLCTALAAVSLCGIALLTLHLFKGKKGKGGAPENSA
ncbi:MAG: hypothetical protein NC541_10105 [bacterium]|nr:hypothetical protein [bacterium]